MSQIEPYQRINKNSIGRSFAIPDIHGCYKTFESLLEKIELTKNDQLFLLGDYVGRSKHSSFVLDIIIDLIENKYQIFPLRGNHEDKLLDAHFKDYSKSELKLPSQWKVKGVTDEKRKILPKYLPLIQSLPYYYILNKFYLVHAGFNFSTSHPFKDYKSMLWIEQTELNKRKMNKIIIHGHSVKPLNLILKSIKDKSKVIGLDNGCVYKNKEKHGNLLCLNLDSFKLTIQKNIE